MRTRSGAARIVLIAIAAATLSAAGCARHPSPPVEWGAWNDVGRWAPARVERAGAERPELVVAPFDFTPAVKGRCLLALRLNLEDGAVVVRVRDGAGAAVYERRLARYGPHLILFPVSAAAGAGGEVRLEVEQPRRTGPLAVELGSLRESWCGSAASAAEAARVEVEQFERETNRLGDASTDNLVPNADFAEDDEVRGTPADWSAYAPIRLDADAHELGVDGAAPDGRPFLATGPMPVVPGRRYRALVRARVDAGDVALWATDYDELRILASEPLASGPARSDRSFELEIPPDVRAVRLALAPARAGEPAAFAVHAVQFELLPESAP